MPVLGTKLHVPTPRRQLVSRARLVDQLVGDPASLPRLVLVSAPAGFGKTTLLTQWLTSSRNEDPGGAPSGQARSVAWLSLDAADSELRQFLTDLIAALQTASPEVGAEAVALLDTDRGFAADAVLSSLVNDLDVYAGRLVVAFDDYHVVDTPAVHEAVTFLLDHLPPQVILALTTRADPPLPLARLRARGELLEFRAADLRFTTEEADVFLNQVMNLDLGPDLVGALEARTEGWAAGLQLAALSARGRTSTAGGAAGGVAEFVEKFSGSNRFVLDYLLEEVLATQSAEVRRFLLDTSVLEQLSGPLCDAVTGHQTGQQVLETLERSNLFLVPLDDERRWFRYHHLFADALRARLLAEDPDRVAGLHRAASGWLAENGVLADAISHAITADDFEYAADLVELVLPQARQDRQNRALLAWLGVLPEDLLRRRPVLALHMGWARLVEGDVDGVEAWLDAAEAGLAAAPAGRSALSLAVPGSLAQAARDREAEVRALPAMVAVYRASVAARLGATSTARSRTPAWPSRWPGRRTTSRAVPPPASSAWRRGPPATSTPRWTRSPRRSPACTRPAWSRTSWARQSCWRTCAWRAAAPTRHDSCTSAHSRSPKATPARFCPAPVTCMSAWPTCSGSRVPSTTRRSILRRHGSWVRLRRCWRTGIAGTQPWPVSCARGVT